MKAYIVSDCGSRYPHEDGKWYRRNEVDAEIAALKAELYNALTTVLCHCSCDGDYDCDRCEANLKRRSQLKQD